MKKMTALVVALAMVTSVSAATFTASIVLPDGNTVSPGGTLAVEVHGVLDTAADNDGLVFVSVDITATGPELLNLGQGILWGPPADASMDSFVQPLGYDANYGGTPVGVALLQSGGAQNTIGNNPAQAPMLSFPSAEFIDFDVAQSNQVILEGELTVAAGQAAGTYTLSLENVLANVLADGQAVSSFGVYSVEAATGVAGQPVDVIVADDCPAAGILVGAAGTSFSDRAFDGFIDARRESDNGVDVNLGLSSFRIVFTTEMEDADGTALSADSFSIVDTAGTAPNVTSIASADGGRTVDVTLSGNIALQQWTTISVNARSQCGQDVLADSINVGYLPGDVDQDAAVGPFDLLRFRQYVNNVSQPTEGVTLDYVDINRNTAQDPFDLLSFRQLINGVTPATQAWQGASLPALP